MLTESQDDSKVGNLLRESEQWLEFDFSGLPSSINQDCEIVITLPSGDNITKWRRLIRAPPLPAGSTALPVQVDHRTKGLMVDGRQWKGVGFYMEGIATPIAGFTNQSDYLSRYHARNGILQGELYGLASMPPEQQLRELDALAAVGYKVMYGTAQLDDCSDTTKPGALCFNDTQALADLKANVTLVKDHPAILGYYICDDCCQSDAGAAYQAQAYNFLRSVDPYHILIGASDCGDTWIFNDGASTCTNKGSLDDPPCPAVSSDTTQPVIEFGRQPRTMLSVDYMMQENYCGGLACDSGDGHWDEGVSGAGWFRNGVPFEAVCNCPGNYVPPAPLSTGDSGPMVFSQAWLAAVMADLSDQLIFIDTGDDLGMVNTAASIARSMHELAPSLRHTFGLPQITANASVLTNSSCYEGNTPADPADSLPGGPLRAAVWIENATVEGLCAHIVVVNIAYSRPHEFRLTMHTADTAAHAALTGRQAQRMFAIGSKLLNISADKAQAPGGLTAEPDWIGPGQTNIYRVGCPLPVVSTSNLAACQPNQTVSIAHCNLNPAMEALADTPVQGWLPMMSPIPPGQDPRVQLVADTTVAYDGRHSLRVLVPTDEPLVIGLAGMQLVPPPASQNNFAVGDLLVGNSAVLPGGRTFQVSLAVQASPPGTTVTLMTGGWEITDLGAWNGLGRQVAYQGQPVPNATVVGRGAHWAVLSAVLRVPVTAKSNSTALQVRVSPPPSARGFGAMAWLDAVSITELSRD